MLLPLPCSRPTTIQLTSVHTLLTAPKVLAIIWGRRRLVCIEPLKKGAWLLASLLASMDRSMDVWSHALSSAAAAAAATAAAVPPLHAARDKSCACRASACPALAVLAATSAAIYFLTRPLHARGSRVASDAQHMTTR